MTRHAITKYGVDTSDTKVYNKIVRQERVKQGFCLNCWSRPIAPGKKSYQICLDKRKQQGVELKSEVIKEYGNECACCGEANINFLTIDHVNDNGAVERQVHGSGFSFYRALKRMGYPKDGYRVLCFNCNCGRRITGGICPHKLGLNG